MRCSNRPPRRCTIARPLAEIAVHVSAVSNLFNSFVPSPFREKDFDADVEAFVVAEWQATVGEQKASNIHIKQGTSEFEYVKLRTDRDRERRWNSFTPQASSNCRID